MSHFRLHVHVLYSHITNSQIRQLSQAQICYLYVFQLRCSSGSWVSLAAMLLEVSGFEGLKIVCYFNFSILLACEGYGRTVRTNFISLIINLLTY